MRCWRRSRRPLPGRRMRGDRWGLVRRWPMTDHRRRHPLPCTTIRSFFVAQQQKQLSQCNEQLLGSGHALDREGCLVSHGVVADSADNIGRDDWQKHCQQPCHRLEAVLFRATALAIRCDAMLHLGRVQKIDGPRFWSRSSSDTGPTPPERHYLSCMPQ